jgi:hypothetical protein
VISRERQEAFNESPPKREERRPQKGKYPH